MEHGTLQHLDDNNLHYLIIFFLVM
jgi:hypothetical protein